jgi:hypothetical protein
VLGARVTAEPSRIAHRKPGINGDLMCIVNSFPLDVHCFNEQSGSQSYVPPDEQDDKALGPALDLLHSAKSCIPAKPEVVDLN